MSRTEGIHLPRLPTSHVRATSSNAVQHHPKRNQPLSEPHYTAYVGTPRQDVPTQVYRDAAMFDDVFDRQGRLLAGRNIPKITNPLNSLEYNSLHDPHCRRLFLNNQALRTHLTSLGLLTDDLRVIANTKEQRQKVRGHELLERKEELVRKLSERERQRIERLQNQPNVPIRYQQSLVKEEVRKRRWEEIRDMKIKKEREKQKASMKRELERKKEKKRQLQEVLQQVKLAEQAKRNAYTYERQQIELETYTRHYGQRTAFWHRESDRIHNRIMYLERTKWSKQRKAATQKDWFSKTYPRSAKNSIIDSPISDKQTNSPLQLIASVDSTAAVQTREEDAGPRVLQEEGKGEITAQVGGTEPLDKAITVSAAIDRKEEVTAEVKMEEKGEDNEAEENRTDQQVSLQHQQKEMPKAVTSETEPVAVSPREEDSKEKELTSKETTVTEEESDETPLESSVGEPFIAERPILLGQQESLVELTNLFFDILQPLDSYGTGHIQIQQFYQVIGSSDLALPLDQEEIYYVGNQISRNGWIPLEEGTTYLPNLLIELFQQRMGEQIAQYGGYIEDRWLQLASPHMGYIYLDKTTGLVQRGGRPLDYRPYLKDDWFEDIIVEFFENADMNRDGYIDQNEMLTFLQSPVVHSRVYTHQLDELLKLFLDQTVEGVMTLEQFVPIAHVILQMIYSNSYPDDEWVELESRKCGKYLFNPSTGETKLPSVGETKPTKPQEGPSSLPKPKSRRRKRKESKEDRRESLTNSKPPPLRKKSGKSIKGGTDGIIDPSTQSEDSVKLESVSTDSNNEVETLTQGDEDGPTRIVIEQVAERLQKGLNLIETIVEEDEELRPESALAGKRPKVNEQDSINILKEAISSVGGAQDSPTFVTERATGAEDQIGTKNDEIVDEAIDNILQKVIDERK